MLIILEEVHYSLNICKCNKDLMQALGIEVMLNLNNRIQRCKKAVTMSKLFVVIFISVKPGIKTDLIT